MSIIKLELFLLTPLATTSRQHFSRKERDVVKSRPCKVPLNNLTSSSWVAVMRAPRLRWWRRGWARERYC
ncbi:hypothetical cytosolic protein [Coxiella burnetii Dugway 5J108-111]|uniref:Hypothetical cytosolic protein n=1 Tax=Coxiella burnetii (strain Dugway 5J108-111) TaxID=434922 RepID=B5XHN9_COXBN|nr:hypothetical cytosolic protein [Coxiella burnetii Dugway 5J108-111]